MGRFVGVMKKKWSPSVHAEKVEECSVIKRKYVGVREGEDGGGEGVMSENKSKNKRSR